MPLSVAAAPMAFALPRSVSKPLLDPRDSLSLFAADYAIRTAVATSETVEPSTWRTALKSVAEAVRVLPVIEKPGDKGHGIYVERTLLDAFLPLNATISVALAFVTASANELTRSNKINDLVTYLAGEDEEAEPMPPSLPWEWDRVGHDTCTNLAKDCGSQTLARYLERRAKSKLGASSSYVELLKHAHKAACKEYHDCRKLAGASGRGMAASARAARMVLRSPTYYLVRSLTGWLADVAVDCVAWWRGELSTAHLRSNTCLKATKYALGGALCLAMGALVPFLYPHPYIFIGVEQLAANLLADSLVETYLGSVQPS